MSSEASRFHVPLRSLKPVRQVVIAASLRPEDSNTVRSGLALAKAVGAKAHVVHAVAWDAYALQLGGSLPGASVSKQLVDRRKEALAELLAEADSEKVTSGIEIGAPYERVLEAAAQHAAGLIIAGAGSGKRRLLGSTTDKLVRRATCPVLIVRDPLSLPLGRTLAPVDLSQLSADSFRCGLSFLHQIQEAGGKVEALFVLGDLMRDSSEPFSSEQVERFAEEELQRFVDEHAGEAAESIERQTRVGDPCREILREAKASGSDLIVIGTHGRSGLERALIGSVTAGVAHAAGCSVLAIPPDVAFGAELADAVTEQMEPRFELPEKEPDSG